MSVNRRPTSLELPAEASRKNVSYPPQFRTGHTHQRWSIAGLPVSYCLPGHPGLAAAAVIVVAAVAAIVVAAVAAAVAEQEQQDDDPPPVVAAEPIADTTVIIAAHKNTSEINLELCRSFHGIPAAGKCADRTAPLIMPDFSE